MAEPAKYKRSFCNEAVNGPVSLCIRAQGEEVKLAILIMTSKCSVPLQLMDWTFSPSPMFFPGLSSKQLWGHLFFKAKGGGLQWQWKESSPEVTPAAKWSSLVKVKVMRPEHMGIRDPVMQHRGGYHSWHPEIGPFQALLPWEMEVTVVSEGSQTPGPLVLGGTHLMSTPNSQGQRNNQIALEVAFDPMPEEA